VAWSIYVLTETSHVVGGSPWLWFLAAGPVAGWAWHAPRWSLVSVPLFAALPLLLRPAPDVPVAATLSPQLLVITVDTLRADTHIWEAAGIADNPAWWTTRALAAAPWTPPSMTSLWLGEDVVTHGGGIEVGGRVSWPRGGWGTAWPVVAQRAGLRTEAIVSNPHLRREAGFATGFDAFWHTDDARERHLVLHTFDATLRRWQRGDTFRGRTRDATVVRFARPRIRGAADVLWVHLLEPHEYGRRIHSTDPAHLQQAYSRAVAQTGRHLRELVAQAGDATVVIVADHGESLGEDGRWGHGRTATAEVLEVPLAVRHSPTVSNPPDGTVSLPDIGRWLAEVLVQPERPLVSTPAPRIAGVRGEPEVQYRWDARTRTTIPEAAPVEAGPPGEAPGPTVREALEALGYLEGSHE
jgi:hypothetical protein